MKLKVQRLLWALLLLYAIIETIELITSQTNGNLLQNTTFPRLFVYYASRIEVFVKNGKYILAFLWSQFLVNGGIHLLLLVPVCMIGARASKHYRVLCIIVRCDLGIILVYCLVDFVGCIVSVPSEYGPLFSAIMDVFVIALSVWSLQTNNKELVQSGDGSTVD